MSKAKGKRLQASLGTERVRKLAQTSNSTNMILARIVDINYNKNTITFLDISNNSSSVASTTSAKLPVPFGGQNGYGNAYGNILPVRVNDIVLIAYVNNKKSEPIVIGRYVDNDTAKEISPLSQDSSVSSTSDEYYVFGNTESKIYPDLTYKYHDGSGSQEYTFPGKTFLSIQDGGITESDGLLVDSQLGTPYEYLQQATYKSGKELNPINLFAPRILFKHEGVRLPDATASDYIGGIDEHLAQGYIDGTGTSRFSVTRKDENWLSYIELDDDSESGDITIRRQDDNETFRNDDVDYAEVKVTSDNEVSITSGSTNLLVTDGHHIIASDTTTGDDSIDLYSGVQDLTNNVSDVSNSVSNIENNLTNTTSTVSTLNSQVALSSSSISQTSSVASSVYGNGNANINMYAVTSRIDNTTIDTTTGDKVSKSGYVASPKQTVIRNFDYTVTAYSVTKSTTIGIAYYDLNKNFIEYHEATGTTGNVSVTSVSPDSAVQGVIYCSDDTLNVKWEQGSSSSNWGPSIVDLYTDSTTINNLVSQAEANSVTIIENINELESHDYASQMVSLDKNSEILASDKSSLQLLWTSFSDDYEQVLSYTNQYAINIDDLTTNYATLKTLIEQDILASMDSDSPSGDFTSLVNSVNDEMQSDLPLINSSVNNNLKTVQELATQNSGTIRNYLLNTSNSITSTGSQKLYQLSDSAKSLSGKIVLSISYSSSDTVSGVLDEVIYDSSDTIVSTTPLLTISGSQTGTVSQFVVPVVPEINQTAYLFINSSDTITFSQAMLTISDTTSITWSEAPEDLTSLAQDKIASLTVQSTQITSAVFDQLLGESAVFTETAAKADLIVSQGEIEAGFEVTAGKLTLFGKEIDIIGDIVDDSNIIGVTIQDGTIESSTSSFKITNNGVATAMSISGSTLSNDIFNLSSTGKLTGAYSISDDTTVSLPVKGSGNLYFDNNGINGTGTIQFYDTQWFSINDDGTHNSTGTNSYAFNINPNYLDYQVKDSSNILAEHKITGLGQIISQGTSSTTISPNSLILENGDTLSLSDTAISSSTGLTISGSTITLSPSTSLGLNGTSVSSTGIYNNTSSDSANVTIDDSGILHRTTSAKKYKTNIEPIDDILNKGKQLINIVPKKWNDKNNLSVEQVGLIADELKESGLDEFLVYKDNELEGIRYDRLFVLLLPILKKILEKVDING